MGPTFVTGDKQEHSTYSTINAIDVINYLPIVALMDSQPTFKRVRHLEGAQNTAIPIRTASFKLDSDRDSIDLGFLSWISAALRQLRHF